MTRLSASNLATVRQQPQTSELYLSIFTPREVMRALVNNVSIARGERIIVYDNSSGEGFVSVEAGMTLLVGTAAGGRDVGKIRIKSVTSTQFVVSENSHILWADNLHLTVLRYWEVFPVYPRIISDPGDAENVIFYKDYDIAYSNQNSVLGAFPCAGNHRALFAGETSYWSSTGTTHLLGSALTYEWAFEGGTPTGSTSANPGNVTYPTPGHYVTRLKVTAANGTLDTTYRYVSVYNNPVNSNTNIPKKNWSLTNLSGSRGEGGYTADLSIVEQDITLNDGDVAVIFADDWYGSTNQSFGGNSPSNAKIFFVGYVVGSSIVNNYKTSTVSFQIASITEMMRHSEGFSVSVESKASPAYWFELLDMDGRRALYHYLKWHTTVPLIADFQFLGQDQNIQFFDSDRESMFDAIDNYMRGTLLGSVCSDRQGKIWAEVGAWGTVNPTGSFPSVMDIQKRDWLGEMQIEESLYPSMSSLELGGVAFSGVSTGTFAPLISNAPGLVPNFRGSAEANQGLALASQSQLNALAGNVYANKNARFPAISFDMSGNYRNLDIAPQEAVQINVSADDTNINTPVNAVYLVDSMSWVYSPKNKSLFTSIGLISLLNGDAAETITIPDVPETGGYAEGGGNFNFGGFVPFSFPFAGSLQAALRLQGLSGYGNSGSAVGDLTEVSWNLPIDQYFNYGGFTITSGTSVIGTGTYSSQLFVPHTGIYWIYGSALFDNIASSRCFMRMQINNRVVYEGYSAASAVHFTADHIDVSGGGLAWITDTSLPIVVGTAYNHAASAVITTINVILLISI